MRATKRAADASDSPALEIENYIPHKIDRKPTPRQRHIHEFKQLLKFRSRSHSLTEKVGWQAGATPDASNWPLWSEAAQTLILPSVRAGRQHGWRILSRIRAEQP
ncbi:hypothetical protein [Gluconacetobacter sp.]|uniref:hypothetical protein n=1 Tax=Gluconacetobacter sp. TaxID=1935994 RepID=UPI0039EA8768